MDRCPHRLPFRFFQGEELLAAASRHFSANYSDKGEATRVGLRLESIRAASRTSTLSSRLANRSMAIACCQNQKGISKPLVRDTLCRRQRGYRSGSSSPFGMRTISIQTATTETIISDVNPVAKKRDLELVVRLSDDQLSGDITGCAQLRRLQRLP